VILGRLEKPSLAGILDLEGREIVVLAPLVILTICSDLSEARARHVAGFGLGAGRELSSGARAAKAAALAQ